MVNIEKELQEYIFNYCESKNMSIDLRFACFGDRNKFYTYSKEFSLYCVSYYVKNFKDIEQFFTDYLDIMLEERKSLTNRIALFVEDIIDRCSWYEVIVGGCLVVDDALT